MLFYIRLIFGWKQQLNEPKPWERFRGMAIRPNHDTEPRVQQLVIGLYLERDIGLKGLANAGLCVIMDIC